MAQTKRARLVLAKFPAGGVKRSNEGHGLSDECLEGNGSMQLESNGREGCE